MIDQNKPLSGLVVLDLTIAMAGPLCTQRLGEMGADVIKIEAPNGGDFSRSSYLGGYKGFGDSVAYVTLNRCKRSLVIDLKKTEGKKILHKMAQKADVLVQNYRPRVASKLEIDYPTLRELNPRLIYVAISGYGDKGPMKDRPGQDLLLQSFSGMTFNGGCRGSLPDTSPLYLVDTVASHHATEGVLAALFRRNITSEGMEVSVNMLNSILEMQIQELTLHMALPNPPERSHSPQVSLWMEPPYGVCRTSDGYLSIAQADLNLLAELLGIDELRQLKENRPSFEMPEEVGRWRDRIYELIQAVLMKKKSVYWDELLDSKGVWCGIPQSYNELVQHPQAESSLIEINHPVRGKYKTVAPAITFSRSPRREDITPAPEYGNDTSAILQEFGLSSEEIKELFNQEVVIGK